MAQYLRDFQAVIDYQLEDVDKNTEMMRELKSEIIKMSALADHNICFKNIDIYGCFVILYHGDCT